MASFRQRKHWLSLIGLWADLRLSCFQYPETSGFIQFFNNVKQSFEVFDAALRALLLADDKVERTLFIEADGGMWKLAARQTVKKFLEEELSALVEAGDVIVTL